MSFYLTQVRDEICYYYNESNNDFDIVEPNQNESKLFKTIEAARSKAFEFYPCMHKFYILNELTELIQIIE